MNSRLVPISLTITAVLLAFASFFVNEVALVPPYSDGGSHYVTGLLAFDWIHLKKLSNPISFGTEYFKHLPYIGLLLWPPFFYFLEMIAFSVFGSTAQVALMLVTAILVAGVTLVGYATWKSGRSALVAHCVIATTLMSVFVRDVQHHLLIDGLVAFLSFATALAFAAYVVKPTLRAAISVAVLAILAFYSKGNAMQLALVLPLIALLMRQPRVLVARPTLILGAICVLITGPWLYLTAGLSAQGALYTPGVPAFLHLVKENSYTLFLALPLLAPFALIGAGAILYRSFKAKSQAETPSRFEAVALAIVIGCVGFHALLAVAEDARYMFTAFFGMVALSVVGIEFVVGLVSVRYGLVRTKSAQSLILIGLLLAQAVTGLLTPLAPVPMGANAIAAAVLSALPEKNRSVMISGDHNVETSVGPALAELEGSKRSTKDGLVVVRGSRALVGGGYRNRDFVAKFSTDEQYLAEIRRLGFPVIVTGIAKPGDSWPHIASIERLLAAKDSDYSKVAEVPFFKGESIAVWRIKPELVKPIDFAEVSASNTLRERVSKVTK